MTCHLTIYTPVLLQYNLYCSRPQKSSRWTKIPSNYTNTDEDNVAELAKDTEKEKVVQQETEIKGS